MGVYIYVSERERPNVTQHCEATSMGNTELMAYHSYNGPFEGMGYSGRSPGPDKPEFLSGYKPKQH